MRIKLQAIAEFLRRYAGIFRQVWHERASLDSPDRIAHELEFLPSTLELQETPVSPAPRVVMWLLIAFALIALLWALFGRIDIVASGRGKIIPNDKVKTIQSVGTAAVRAIHVDDGQFVKAGEALIDLDSTDPEADVSRLQYDMKSARLSVARNQIFLDAIDRMKGSAKLPALEGISEADIRNEQRSLDGQLAEFRGRLGELDAEIARRHAEENSSRERISKLEQTSRIATQRVEDFKSLLDKNFISKHAYQDREQYRIEQQQDLAVEKSRLLEVRAALSESQRKREVLVAETRRIAMDQIEKGEHQSSTTSQELLKAEQRNRLTQLTAPVDGTVQQLAVHTVGGVVTEAQPLMVIVPKDNPLQVEVYLENKDIGFVKAGQAAEVKVEAFPYTKYGTLQGKVLHISNDAINDEKRGLIFLARIQLEKATMRLEEREVSLTPGMAVTVEIKTGNRRVIEYFLSPLLQYSSESFKER